MIILTDKKLVIPVGIAPNYAGAGNTDIKLQSKSVTITENGSKTLFPDGNYDGFSQVNIKTNVASVNPVLEDKSVEISENGDYRFTPGPAYDGIGNFRIKVNVETYDPIPVESVKTAYPSFENDVTVTPSEGFEAMSTVIVKKAEPNLQDKNVDKASTSEIVLRADAGYQGLGTVTVAPIKTKTVSADPSTNVQEFSANTEYNEYITSVTVNPVNTTSINVDPSTNEQVVNAPENTYISTVTVNPVVTNTVNIDSSTNYQEVNANVEGNEYITSVTVNPVKTKSLYITPRIVEQIFTAEQQLYKTVNVNPVTSSIDPNIVPENIAKGVSILGVTGEANTDNFNDLVNTYGAALTVKMKVDKIYTEANDNIISDSAADNYQTSNEGDSGFIDFFGYYRSGTDDYGSLADRGIVAYAINGELHKAPDTNTAFIPYTKQSNGYDDVVVDVYVDFKQSGRWCAEKEEENYETSPYYGASEVEYCYLPPIVDFRNYRFIKTTEIIVRNSVNALGPYAIYNRWYGNYGNLIFEPCVDGIKRFHTKITLGNDFINKIYIYGNLEDYAGMFGSYSYNDSFSHEIYGNIKNYPDCLTNVDLINANFHGSITTKDNTPLRLYKKTDNAIDFYEECTKNNYGLCKKYRVIIPASCTELNINNPHGSYAGVTDRYYYNKENEEIIFFSTTPPSLPKENYRDQQKLSTSDPNSAIPNNSNLKRVFIPAGSNYDSILREPPFKPQVIEFTPVTDLSTINRAGYYGYTAPDGSHTLLNVATTSQAESDIETIATEINNL